MRPSSALARSFVTCLALLSLAFTPTSCIVAEAANAGAGAAGAWVTGRLNAQVSATPTQVMKATKSAFEELDFELESAKATTVDARITGRTALDKEVTVEVTRKEDHGSTLSIRVGTFGDEELSHQILRLIEKHL